MPPSQSPPELTPPTSSTSGSTSGETQNSPALHLSRDPAQVAAYLKQRRAEMEATHTEHSDTTPDSSEYSFIDFAQEMGMTNFEDVFQIRGMLESQVQMLGMVFQYLLMGGDWKHLPTALRAQKVMRETIDLMNGYPSLSHQYYFHPDNPLSSSSDIGTSSGERI